MHGYILNTVATETVVMKLHTFCAYIADQICIAFD